MDSIYAQIKERSQPVQFSINGLASIKATTLSCKPGSKEMFNCFWTKLTLSGEKKKTQEVNI